jgi:hypothetical protein
VVRIYSVSGGRVESCVSRISWDPVGLRVRLCGFRSVCFDLQLSLLEMVVAP